MPGALPVHKPGREPAESVLIMTFRPEVYPVGRCFKESLIGEEDSAVDRLRLLRRSAYSIQLWLR